MSFRKPVLGALLLGNVLTGCKTSAPVATPTPPEPVILKLGGKTFTTSDFFQSFTKNQMATDSARRTDIREYFDLYTNLKLKVIAAEQEGRDTTEAFREELATYRKQLAQSYLNDKVLIDNLASEAYERMKEEINASHLLVGVAEDAPPADTLAAWETAQSLRKRALEGEDFAALARQYSKDPTASANGGNLGYFTVFQYIYPIETAAYGTPTGGISAPVRSRSGYHLVKVNARRPSRGKVRVAHIQVRASPGAGPEARQAAESRINEVYDRLQKGESFDNLVREFSDDRESRSAGGELPVFGIGRQEESFEEAAFSLNQPGSFSRPVQTSYGWHIIRLLERIPLETYEQAGPMLRQKVLTDTRGELLRQALVQRLRKEYTVTESPDVVLKAFSLGDSSLLLGKWRLPARLDPALDNKPIVRVGRQSYAANDFLESVLRRQQPRAAGSSPAVVMQRLFRRYVDDKLIEQEEAGLELKHPEFRALMNDIRDGVLLSQVMEQNVWEKALADSVGQQAYYDQNKARYRYPERAVAAVFSAIDESTLQQAKEMLAKRPYPLRRSVAEQTYAANQSILTARQRESLFDLLVILIKNTDYLVEVTGSADRSEADTISASRIRNVVNYLTANGIPLTRIMEKDYGKFRPAARGADARRVTFQLFSNAKEDVVRTLNAKSPSAVVLTEGVFSKGQNAAVDAVAWQPGTTLIRRDGRVMEVTIERIEAPRPKTFAEARGAVINDYQAVLEKQWLDRLKQRYPVQVNEEEVRRLVK